MIYHCRGILTWCMFLDYFKCWCDSLCIMIAIFVERKVQRWEKCYLSSFCWAIGDIKRVTWNISKDKINCQALEILPPIRVWTLKVQRQWKLILLQRVYPLLPLLIAVQCDISFHFSKFWITFIWGSFSRKIVEIQFSSFSFLVHILC